MSYTINGIPNPSFENTLGTTGYTAFSGATLTTEYTDALYGSNSMRVTTDGTQSGQGFYSPYVQEFHTAAYSGSIYLKGTDHVQVKVHLVLDPGGVSLVTKVITLTEDWQRITVPNGSTGEGNQSVYIVIRTVAPVATTFLVDGVQIEKNSVVTEYCDGDQYGCYWTGTPNASPSVREVEFALETDGFNQSDGTLSFVVPGEAFDIEAFGDQDVSGGSLEFSLIEPVGALDDFAVFPLLDPQSNSYPDPAMTYIAQTNAGTLAGEYGKDFARQYALFVPPRDYPVSGGLAWKRAQYSAVGFKYVGLPAGDWNYLDDIQLEPFKVGLAGTGPTAYETPRQIKTIIKPDRLNFVKNPSFETSLNYWTKIGGTPVTISQDSSTIVPVSGNASMKVHITSSTSSPGASTDVENLIIGRTYVASAYVQGSEGLQDVLLTCGNGTSSVTGDGIPYGGVIVNPDDLSDPANIGYGEGPYGGMFATGSSDSFPVGVWIRTSFTFTATAEMQPLVFDAATNDDATYPVDFWIDAVLVEEGEVLQPYFDGSFGYDYLWESGGTPNEARSYYYEGRRAKVYIVDEIIKDYTPLGISAAEAQYAVPYSQ